ncbi:DUF1801 domain-containing protein [Fluviicola chungangensis]|uniref:DUF1801 domain-containing protein n=1 Tax=Fluviicola chungangensis TaxID=2597671 RepID=UPI001C90DD0D|nr:DUF1801 domain-containing protein [Fluviicola chungangensis]
MAEKKPKLAEIKTKPTAISAEDFINTIPDIQKQKDCFVLIDRMKKATGQEPVMWGGSIIGFGNMRYESPRTGRQVDWFLVGFSPRKANLTLYIGAGSEAHTDALKILGKHKVSGGCLHINKLADVDLNVLQGMIDSYLSRK